MSEVVVRDVTKRFGSVEAVDRCSLTVEDGELLTVLGPSGCGKTTLLRMIAGLVQPDEGSILIGGQEVHDVPPYERNLAMVFQHYTLFPHMTVAENVAFGLRMRGWSKEECAGPVARALDMVQLLECKDRRPKQLSGGQQQRIALARAIVYEPDVLLLDEPFGALDKKLRDQMEIELRALQRRLNITTIFVTHDQEEALTISSRIAVMCQGSIQQVDAPRAIYETPASAFVCDFVGETNLLSGRAVAGEQGPVFETDRGYRLSYIRCEQPTDKLGVSIRPERIQLVAGDEAAECEVMGMIVESIYVGSVTRYHVEFSTGERLIAVESASREGSIPVGTRVGLIWSPDDVVILPGEGVSRPE